MSEVMLGTTARKIVDDYKNAGLKKIIEQLEMNDYQCEGGFLKNNVAFIALKEISEEKN